VNIIELRAQNFARLSAVTIRPDGALVQITGRNGQGKSSILNSIWVALKGRAAAPPQPIHKGAEEARIDLDIGSMRIVRTFKIAQHKGGKGEDVITSDLKVTMADGRRIGVKPQSMIDALLGDLSFDPLEFARLPANEQFDRVRALVPNFDFEENAARRAEAFDERTIENRKAKDARARAEGIKLPPGPKPKAESTAALAAKLQAATEQNAANGRRRLLQENAKAEIERKLDEAEQLRARAATLEKEAAKAQSEFDKLAPVPDDVDTKRIADELAAADKNRQTVAQFEERERHETEAQTAEEKAAELTAAIEQCDHDKRTAIEATQMPVDGLSFGEDEVLLNGLPFSQAGTAEKIRASMGIGMSLNPQLRVMLIDEGSELDAQSLKMVAELAAAKKYQVWLTRVTEGDAAKVGFEIVDGAVAGAAS
jgi:DNA repair exonuclease SbcCD ATPase subunit